jgi:hypothetical protein
VAACLCSALRPLPANVGQARSVVQASSASVGSTAPSTVTRVHPPRWYAIAPACDPIAPPKMKVAMHTLLRRALDPVAAPATGAITAS